ncbi:MAG TPA: YegS/Rv2252/BmrU family lipid kinase [Verrucomicrobiae bacterium]|jgi:YegS/Rv2252/BmrU family lipid kinase|nr:YegS/Rv2252/BmrU family lipid kinase [Verrucomicrobiae bacterium]
MREVVLIARLTSNRGPEAFTEVSKALTAHGISIVEAHQVENSKELRKRVKRAVKSGHKLIVVAGGDGSQTAAVGPMAYTKAVLGVIPAGTGNSFAQTLGIKPTIEDAIHTILNGTVAEVDLGVINGKYFANFATIGLSAEIGLDTPELLKKLTGSVAYGLSAIVPMLRQQPFPAKISWENNALKVETYQMVVANGRFFGNTPILPDAEITSGRLSFFTTAGAGRLDMMRMYLAFLNGTHTQLPDAHYFQTKKLTIKTKGRQKIAVDGRDFGYTPATFSVASKALRVMVPIAASEAITQ